MKKHILFVLALLLINTKSQAKNYDDLYPIYAEACSGSQEKPFHAPQGGPAGHIFMYLKGVCRDWSQEYSRLKMCDGGGTVVSVDQVFGNVNWIAIDDKDFAFHGGVAANEKLDEAAKEKAVQQAIRKGYFKNIFRNRKLSNPDFYPNVGEEEWLAREGLGTNYALTFHRNLRCAKIPLPADRMNNLISYLNGLNDEVYSGQKNYNWSMWNDNCAHVVHNAFAAAGMWEFKKTNTSGIEMLLNISIPPNEWVQTERYGNRTITDPIMMYHDSEMSKNLTEGWIPAQQGSLVETYSIHTFENTIADTNSTFMIVDIPKIGFYNSRANKFLNDKIYSDLKSNLLYYRDLYAKALKPLDRRPDYTYTLKTDANFQKFYETYRDFMLTQSNDVEAKLSRLEN